MFIKNKKGDVRTEPISILGLEIGPGVFLLLLFIAICVALYALFFNFSGINCENSAEWKQVNEALTKIDNQEVGSIDIQFFNKGCYLIGFSDPSYNQYSPVTRGEGVGIKPQICLCSLEEIRCDAQYCKKFENIKIIKDLEGRQLNTKIFPQYTTLKLTKTGNELLVTSPYASNLN